MNTLTITLPYPPTANTYYRKYRGRMVLSDRGRVYKDTAAKLWRAEHGLRPRPMSGRLSMLIQAWMPDRRVRDIDNIQKPVLDSLKGFAYEDDKTVRDLRTVERGVDKDNPRVEITVTKEAEDE